MQYLQEAKISAQLEDVRPCASLMYIAKVLLAFGIEYIDDGLRLSLLLNTTP